jgi:hypothetical protein
LCKTLISREKSFRSFALDHDIDEKVVRKISANKKLQNSCRNFKKICDGEEISLSDFFKLLEK